MKFNFDRDAMIKEIAIAQEIISTRNAGSILSNILLSVANNTLTIKATDIKVNFETKIPVESEEDGTTTVFCDKFMGILGSLPSGEIEFEQKAGTGDDQGITVTIRPTTKKVKFQMKSMSQEKFPEFNSAEAVPYFDVPSKDLKEMIAQTIFAVSEDQTRYFMNGVYFEKKGDNLVLVATDGRRLSYCSKAIVQGVSDFTPAIVPPKVLSVILKHAGNEGTISLAIVDKMIFFKFGSYELASTLLEGQFPNYQRVIPEKQTNSFQVQKADLVEALKRIALMVDKKAGRIYLNLAPGTLRITSSQQDFGSADEEIPCEYAGSEARIAVNYSYLEEPLPGIATERVALDFTDVMKAVTLRPEPASDYFHIIMPMQAE